VVSNDQNHPQRSIYPTIQNSRVALFEGTYASLTSERVKWALAMDSGRCRFDL
jgi:hypothetical protein